MSFSDIGNRICRSIEQHIQGTDLSCAASVARVLAEQELFLIIHVKEHIQGRSHLHAAIAERRLVVYNICWDMKEYIRERSLFHAMSVVIGLPGQTIY